MLFSDLEEASAQGPPSAELTDQSLGETQRPQRLCGDLDPDGKNDPSAAADLRRTGGRMPEVPLTRPRQSTGGEVTNIAEGPADVTQLESAAGGDSGGPRTALGRGSPFRIFRPP